MRRKTVTKFWLAGIPVVVAAFWAAGPLIPLGGTIHGRGRLDRHVIALTFDDGPNPATTPGIVEVLDRYGIKGTFFMVGENVARHPQTAQLVARHGDEIGNHSLSHGNFLPYYLPWFIGRDFDRAQADISAATGVRPVIYRAPHGRVTPWMRLVMRLRGVAMIGWDYSPRDWESTGADTIAARVTAAARDGSVILLHDGLDLNDSPDRSNTLEALPRIIETLQSRGYRFVTVPEMFNLRP